MVFVMLKTSAKMTIGMKDMLNFNIPTNRRRSHPTGYVYKAVQNILWRQRMSELRKKSALRGTTYLESTGLTGLDG